MKNRFFALITLFFVVCGSEPAFALDIPLLTWEQGKAQSVVLGGPNSSRSWNVQLISKTSSYVGDFSASAVNESGYRVYTINLPSDIPEGSYIVQTRGPGSPRTEVAQVVIVPLAVYEVRKAPVDLLIILLLLSLLIASVNFARNRNFRSIKYFDYLADSRRLINGTEIAEGSSLRFSTIELARVRALEIIPLSLMKILLSSNSSYIYFKSRKLFSILPILSIVLSGVYFALDVNHPFQFTAISSSIFILLIFISIFDLLSGFCAAIIYLALSVIFQQNFGIDVLVSLVFISACFIVPSISIHIGSLLQNRKVFAWQIIWSLLGSAYIPFTFLILKSLNREVITNSRLVLVFTSALFLLGVTYCRFLQSSQSDSTTSREDQVSAEISRVVSPIISVGVFLIFLATFFNWSKDFRISVIGAFFWSLPIVVSSIKLPLSIFQLLSRFKRRIEVEGLLIVVAVIGIFLGLQRLPWLIDDRATAMLCLAALPAFFHSIYVMFAESQVISETDDLEFR